MNIKETMSQVHQNAVDKGFWEGERKIGELLMLVTSELAEALEADRDGYYSTPSYLTKASLMGQEDKEFKLLFIKTVKNSFEDEIADAVIRLFDLAEGKGIDLEWHIKAKMRYNSLRERLHGKKY